MVSIEQVIKRYSIDAINVLIYNDINININPNKIINLIIEGMSIKDIKTNDELYPHLNNIGISKNIYNYNNDDNNNDLKNVNNINIHQINNTFDILSNIYDVLIINSLNKENTINIINKYINNISITILIANEFDYMINYPNWVLNNNSTNSILTYSNTLYDNNLHHKIFNYYELMHITNKIININDFFLIKSSCLGCVRNRNHIVFCDTIHICINNIHKNNILQLKPEFNKYNISLTNNIIDDFCLLKLKDVAQLKIHFYNISNDIIIIRNDKEQSIHINELGNLKKYNYGPILVNSLEYPNNYLKKMYGENVFTELKHDELIIKIPKYMYDCYYNQWSSYTSDYWKNKQISNLYNVYNILKSNNINCWIDCGTLLGAARNNNICLFDDDTDIGVFEQDLNSINNILATNNIQNIKDIKYINHMSFEEYYNLNISYNKKENINYTFFANKDVVCEFRAYVKINNKYLSTKDKIVSNAHKISGLMEKRAVDLSFFDELTTIKLGEYIFNCPSNYKEYLESNARYGKGSIEGNPIRDCKPGVVVLYDDFR